MVVKPSAFKGKMNKTLNTKFLNRVHWYEMRSNRRSKFSWALSQITTFSEQCLLSLTPWRNGSASDSRSEGCVFKSRRGQPFNFWQFFIIIIIILNIIINHTNSLKEAPLYTVYRPSLVYFFAHGRDFSANRFFSLYQWSKFQKFHLNFDLLQETMVYCLEIKLYLPSNHKAFAWSYIPSMVPLT